MSGIVVRAATVEDRGPLCRLLGTRGGTAVERAVELALAPRSSAWVIVAARAGVVVGAALANPVIDLQGGRLILEELHVAAPHRRRGVGRALVDHLALEARRYGLGELVVDVAPDEDGAAAFIAALGFSVAARRLHRRSATFPADPR